MVRTIRLVALDIDGVLTDGTASAVRDGVDKRISFHDLDAVTALRCQGIEVALVTGEDDESVGRIADRFGVATVVRGAKDKVEALGDLAARLGVGLDEVCFVGDSDRDAAALQQVALGLAPANATPAARAAAHRVLAARGGDGAVAEAARMVIQIRALAGGSEGRRQALGRVVADSQQAHGRIGGDHLAVLDRIAHELANAIAGGRKILIFGNGGSAADSQHVAGELVGRLARESDPWPAIALTTDTSILTCVGNDWSFAEVFRRQVRALARPGDVVVGISTSGRSENVLLGLSAARQIGAVTIGFAGATPGPLGDAVDVCFRAPASTIPRIQELHLLAWHAVCEVVEAALMGVLPDSPK